MARRIRHGSFVDWKLDFSCKDLSKRKKPIGPDGSVLTLADLPRSYMGIGELKSETGVWAPRDKLLVVLAVRQGLIQLTEAFEKYLMSIDEFISWSNQTDNPTIWANKWQSKSILVKNRGMDVIVSIVMLQLLV